jgi:hypothetical protein
MTTVEMMLDDRITQMINDAGLARPGNKFFEHARSIESVEPRQGLEIALSWQAMTRAFMFTTVASLGVLARRFSTAIEPDKDVLGAYQTAYLVIGDDMANLAPMFGVAPKGPAGVHYVWWAETITAPLIKCVGQTADDVAGERREGVAALIANMERLAEAPLGAAVQLRVVEAIALDIAVAFRRIYSKIEVDGAKLYRESGALDWIDSHIKAETSHASSVTDDEAGMTFMASTEAEREEFARLAEEYTASWARALADFDAVLEEGTR